MASKEVLAQMTEEEVVSRYRRNVDHERDKRPMIETLADLNAVGKGTIIDILRRHGADLPDPNYRETSTTNVETVTRESIEPMGVSFQVTMEEAVPQVVKDVVSARINAIDEEIDALAKTQRELVAFLEGIA